MKRVKRHKIKQEMPETSTSRFRDQEEHDLAYYIHDRVELMHQVFSVIKPKELKAMAPECVHHISVDDLQELCTEELLGISSKRLCAILDGADPPTDTESSSSEHLETISLDSISSDDEILSQHSSKKKHKHKKHKSKSKHKRKNSKSGDKGELEGGAEEEERSRASRAGLTVLELLELQARARAIRAQLQQDNAHAAPAKPQQTETQANGDTSEDEVEIKEEPAEVVEISSDEDKPNIADLPVKPPSPSKDQTPGNSKTVIKRVNDLIVTVPHTKQNKKIVLNRNKTVSATKDTSEISKTNESKDVTGSSKASSSDTATKAKVSTSNESTTKTVTQEKTKASEINDKVQSKTGNNKTKQKKKQKKKDNKSDKEEDHDEITLQLSDTEKMDLLEDFDRKDYENFTSSSEDSESSSESESENETFQDSTLINQENGSNATKSQESDTNITKHHENAYATNYVSDMNSQVNIVPVIVSAIPKEADISTSDHTISENNKQEETAVSVENIEASTIDLEKDANETSDTSKNIKYTSPSSSSPVKNSPKETVENGCKDKIPIEEKDTSPIKSSDKSPIIEIDGNKTPNVEVEMHKTSEEVNKIADNQKHQVVQSIIIQVKNDNFKESESKETQQNIRSVIVRVENDNSESVAIRNENSGKDTEMTKQIAVEKVNECETKLTDKNESIDSIEEGEIINTNKDLSEGEITDTEEQQENQNNNTKSPEKSVVVCVSDEEGDKRKKKKKKEKKSKKEKKTKKTKSDFCEGADQNFFREEVNTVIVQEKLSEHKNTTVNVDIHDGNDEKYEIVVIPEDTELVKQGTEIIHDENKDVDDVVSLDDDDDIYEILEISDDSSCYEVEGISVSKEPTAAEIAALSAKIDEIHSGDVIVINENDREDGDNGEIDTNKQDNQVNNDEIENISWRDRYLGSKKVKRVLTTSNILNALRKKNKELKRKLEESKKKIEQATEGDKVVLAEISEFVEGSIEHFNTLEGSTKYVDPVVPEVPKENDPEDANKEGVDTEVGIKQVTKEMEKDAKQLLKMYKRLLKYNDMNKKKDPTKKKKKKHKKNKEKDTTMKEK